MIDIAAALAPFDDVERVASKAVLPSYVALIRGDLIVWAGPAERLVEDLPRLTDIRRIVLNPEDLHELTNPPQTRKVACG